jgi:hypothetical protein
MLVVVVEGQRPDDIADDAASPPMSSGFQPSGSGISVNLWLRHRLVCCRAFGPQSRYATCAQSEIFDSKWYDMDRSIGACTVTNAHSFRFCFRQCHSPGTDATHPVPQ